jgi:hypothetical protein
MPDRGRAIPKSYASRFHDLKLTRWGSVRQQQSNPTYESEDGVFVLPLRPKNDDSSVPYGRVCLDVREIQVQGEQDPALGSTPARYRRILRARQAFIGDRVGFEPSTA